MEIRENNTIEQIIPETEAQEETPKEIGNNPDDVENLIKQTETTINKNLNDVVEAISRESDIFKKSNPDAINEIENVKQKFITDVKDIATDSQIKIGHVSEGSIVEPDQNSEEPTSFKRFGEKTKELFSDQEVRNQVKRAVIETVGHMTGLNVFVDLPAYEHQRREVRGVFGNGGIKGVIENIVSASQQQKNDRELSKKDDQEKDDNEIINDYIKEKKGPIQESLLDLNYKLSLTKEGNQKGSEQRKKIAELLRDSRKKDSMSKQERDVEISNILDNYTETKVTGIQAIKGVVNAGLTWSGSFVMKGIAFGVIDAVERYKNLNKAKTREGSDKKTEWVKDVFIGAVKQTFDNLMFKDETGKKTKLEKNIDFADAGGKIALYLGMALAGVADTSFGDKVDTVLDVFSDKGKVVNKLSQHLTLNATRNNPA